MNPGKEQSHPQLEERGADPSMADAGGGKTGLLVKTYQNLRRDRDAEYPVGSGTIREIGHPGAGSKGARQKPEAKISLKHMTDKQFAKLYAEIGELCGGEGAQGGD